MSDNDKSPNSGLIKAEIEKKNAEAFKVKISTITEALKGAGIFVALCLSLYANFTKADASDVSDKYQKTSESIAVVAENIEDQHDQSEKIRETVEGQTSAVKAIASAAVAKPSDVVTISDGPVKSGCWTIQGGVVKCRGVGSTDADADADAGTTTPTVKIDVPEAPPPAKAPKKIDIEERL